MNAQAISEVENPEDAGFPLMRYEQDSDTLLIDDVAVRIDFQLGDDDLGVGLLVESLEEQYKEMVAAAADSEQPREQLLALQSTKEWVSRHGKKVAGLLRYLKSLTADQNQYQH